MNKIIKLGIITMFTGTVLSCINDSSTATGDSSSSIVTTSPVAMCEDELTTNGITTADVALYLATNKSCIIANVDDICGNVENVNITNALTTVTFRCDNDDTVQISIPNITPINTSSSSIIDSYEVSSSNGTSSDAISSTMLSSSNVSSSSNQIVYSSSSIISINSFNIMKNTDSVIERTLFRYTSINDIVYGINDSRDSISFALDYRMHNSSDTAGLVQFKFNSLHNITQYTTLTFKAHGNDTLNVCFTNANSEGGKTYYNGGIEAAEITGDSAVFTGGVCFRAALASTDSVYTFDLTTNVSIGNNLSKIVGYPTGLVYVNTATETASARLLVNQLWFTNILFNQYWNDIKNGVMSIEVRGGYIGDANVHQVVTDLYLK